MHFFPEPVYITVIPFESLINLQSGCMQVICDTIFLWLARLTPPLQLFLKYGKVILTYSKTNMYKYLKT